MAFLKDLLLGYVMIKMEEVKINDVFNKKKIEMQNPQESLEDTVKRIRRENGRSSS